MSCDESCSGGSKSCGDHWRRRTAESENPEKYIYVAPVENQVVLAVKYHFTAHTSNLGNVGSVPVKDYTPL